MVTKWLERKIDDLILGLAPIPYADEEVIELAEGVLDLDIIPGLTPINYHDLSLFQKLFLILPVLDNEYLDLLGFDVFKDAENAYKNDKGRANSDSNPNKWQENGRTVMADGGEDKGRRSRGGMSGVNRDTTWSDNQGVYRDIEGNNESAVNWSFVSSAGKFVAILGILGVLGFAATSFLGSASGPASVAGDYLGANVDGPDLGGIGFMANKAVKTVSCFGDEGCIREWQLNNTRRPGSEDVGETYKLNIQNFQVYGSGGNADVGYSSPSDSIPIYFLVQNARNGLKGIDASNVEYRVKVRDEGLLSSRNYCETDWLELQTSYGSDSEENVLIPGAASEPLEWQDQLTLQECGLLQPGPGNYVNFVLEVKYDYASQSTLYVDAMSQEHRRSQQIPIDFKRSETADTPVETFIETRSPLLFSESNGERTSIPFTTRVGVHTDNRDIDYTIDTSEFVFEDSSITEDVDGSCQGLESVSGEDSENEYVLSSNLSSQIENRQRSDDGDIQWFNYQSQPPPASCTMKLSDSAEGVSRTGETLTMSADVEYTVKLEEKQESFQILNSRCSTANCPMLVPLRGEEISEKVVNIDLNSETPSYSENEEYWTKQYAYCRGNQDAQNGCSVIESFDVGDRGDPRDVTIEEGDMAVDLSTADNSLIHCDSEKPESGVQSVDPNELEKAVNSGDQALSESVSGWRVESTESCS